MPSNTIRYLKIKKLKKTEIACISAKPYHSLLLQWFVLIAIKHYNISYQCKGQQFMRVGLHWWFHLCRDKKAFTLYILGSCQETVFYKELNEITKTNHTNKLSHTFCRDGASLCGVFCAVYNAIQQLNMDNEVDVFSVVRQLQIRRPELCSTLVIFLRL